MNAEEIVRFIANDYWELSSEKVRNQYTEYKKLCIAYIKEHTHGPVKPNDSTFNDDF